MDLLYSMALLLALLAGGLGLLLGTWARRRAPRRAGRAARVVLGVAGLSLAVSVGVHAWWGHGPASAEPMDMAKFVAVHPAFLVAGGLVVLGLAVLAIGRRA